MIENLVCDWLFQLYSIAAAESSRWTLGYLPDTLQIGSLEIYYWREGRDAAKLAYNICWSSVTGDWY